MNKIKIKNFGPLRKTASAANGWITGNQGGGKSTVAKLVSTFTWIEKVLTRGDFKEKEFMPPNSRTTIVDLTVIPTSL